MKSRLSLTQAQPPSVLKPGITKTKLTRKDWSPLTRVVMTFTIPAEMPYFQLDV